MIFHRLDAQCVHKLLHEVLGCLCGQYSFWVILLFLNRLVCLGFLMGWNIFRLFVKLCRNILVVCRCRFRIWLGWFLVEGMLLFSNVQQLVHDGLVILLLWKGKGFRLRWWLILHRFYCFWWWGLVFVVLMKYLD